MKLNTIRYKIKNASEDQIYLCLSECRNSYAVPLDKRVNLHEYAQKIFGKSVTFEAWSDSQLLGFVAAYMNDAGGGSAFITNVSVLKKYRGLGMASRLLDMCIAYAKKQHFREILLEVQVQDSVAIGLYNKLNFRNTAQKKDILNMKKELI